MRRALLVVVALAGCGRHNFDPLADGDAAGDTSDSSSCAHVFCDDFDRGPPVDSGWDSMTNTGGATLTVTGGTYVVSLPAPALESGFLVKQLPTATATIRIAFRISYASMTPGTAEIDLLQLRWNTPVSPCTAFGYYFVRDGTGPFDLQETYPGCGGNEDTGLRGLDNTGFHDVVMTLAVGAVGTSHVRVDLDGATLVDKTPSHAIPSSSLTLNLGAGAVRNMSAPWTITYDNLTIDVL